MATETSIRLDYEDYAAIPYDGRRHEIINGEHYVNPAPNLRHQLISIRLATALQTFVQQHDLGYVFAAPTDVALSEHEIFQPDILFVTRDRAHILSELKVSGAPDLVIEILSTNREFDERLKHQSYERAGVREYWIVDPFSETVTIFRRDSARFAPAVSSDVLTTPLLPAFALSVRNLFP